MKRFFEFNTGRQYGPAGQPIQCLAENGQDGWVTVHFVDSVRMISGVVCWYAGDEAARMMLGGTSYLEAKLMRAYDMNDYSYADDPKVAEINEHYRRA
jgi:hypothetical protein